MGSWGSYPSIFNLGHRAIKDLLTVDVNVEEKVDGSQFSFGAFDADPDDNSYSGRHLKIRSKGAVMHIDAPEKMFSHGVETVKALADELHVGWTYRSEYLAKPKHNALAYDRTPNGRVIIFDINVDDGGFLSYEDKLNEATRLGLETVPLLFSGRIESIGDFRKFLSTTSILGGQTIEGVVVKPTNYDLYGLDKKVLMGKFVSEAFKEVHKKAWGEANPGGKDIIGQIVDRYKTIARWRKALQHLRERGLIENSPRDIGIVLKEIPEDIKSDSVEDIKDYLFAWAWPHIRRGITAGFPQWYKELLLAMQFENEDSDETQHDQSCL